MSSESGLLGILETLHRFEVEFVVIGGLAVGYHGFVRATKDVDIVPRPAPDNVAALERARRAPSPASRIG